MKIKRRERTIERRSQKRRSASGRVLSINKEDNRFQQCTRIQRQIIYQAMEMGLPVRRAIDLAGVTRSQHCFWMKRGLERNTGRYYFYRKRILQYKSQREAEALRVIREAQNGGAKIRETRIHIGGKFGREITRTTKILAPKWGAAAWYLERIHPEQYALKTKEEETKDPQQLARDIRASLEAIDQSVPEEV